MMTKLALLARDNEGYLLNPQDWSEELAEVLAQEQHVVFEGEHKTVILFVRDYYEQHDTVPEVRKVLKFMRTQWGEERATRKYLYQLFPHGFAQQACKIAGMRKPLKLMLDL